jgi:hypothetical protein
VPSWRYESDDAVIANMSADMKQSEDIYGSVVTAVSIFTDKSSSLDCNKFKSLKLKCCGKSGSQESKLCAENPA